MREQTEKLAAWIGESAEIVFFGGAGVSTESGIPDFRSESGLYRAKTKYGHTPEELISHSFFTRDPEAFFGYYKENLIYPDAKPNKAHLALAELERRGRLAAVVTQNIDGLHQAAGSRRVFELHGSVRRNFCLGCGAGYALDYVLDPARCADANGRTGNVPRCERCGGVVRPDVVLYEEALDPAVSADALRVLSRADMLIVGGTSLVVYPAAGLLAYFTGTRLALINKTETGMDQRAGLVIHASVGEVLDAALRALPPESGERRPT